MSATGHPPTLIRGVESAEVGVPYLVEKSANVVVDWFAGTLPCDGPVSALSDAQSVAKWMGLTPDLWFEMGGRYFYRRSLRQGHVEILFDG